MMTKLTNKKIGKQAADADSVPYKWSGLTGCILLGIILISGVCGALISEYAISGMAVIKLGACYFAVLGAAVIDYKLRIIPNEISLSLLGVWVLTAAYECFFADGSAQLLIGSLIGCLLCFVVLLLGNKFSKGGIGGGDIKLLCCIGLIGGAYLVFTTLLLALLCCCVFAVVGVLVKKLTLKNSVPFGPFIYIGYVLVCLMTLY